MLELEKEYRASILDHLASLGQTLPPGVDPLDITLPSLESSDTGGCGLVRYLLWVNCRCRDSVLEQPCESNLE